MPGWIMAGLWGLVGGGALVVGAAIGVYVRVPQRAIAAVMAFGAGVLFSALAFELMDQAYDRGGFWASALGFLAGAIVFSAGNALLARHGAKHRKRSQGQQPSESQQEGSGAAIALGALLDGIPESIAIGVSLIAGGAVSLVTVAAVFLSNVPEGLASAAGMRAAGRSKKYIFGVWCGIAILTGIAAVVGYVLFQGLSPEVVAATLAVAAGAILAMLVDTMIPEAFEGTHLFAGVITVTGFLVAFVLSKLGG